MTSADSKLYSSVGELRKRFEQGLIRLLEQEGLGVFILVLANASFDRNIHQILERTLHQRFDQLMAHYRNALRKGRSLSDTADDLLVFLKLMAVGFEHIRTTEFRRAGPWEIQFNHVRSFRPARMTSQRVHGIYRSFDPDGFNFSKPFLEKEILWRGLLNDRDVSLFYNKFPFAELHCLLVPEPRSHKPQFLEQVDHCYIWELTEKLGRTIEHVGFGYNSYGALASVNHLHFQMFVREADLPVQSDIWRHNDGERDYPLPCLRFDSMQEAWRQLDELHESETSYNLVYLPGHLYCLPRKQQGSYTPAAWTGGFAWHEVAGCATTFGYDDFEALTEQQITDELAMLGIASSGSR